MRVPFYLLTLLTIATAPAFAQAAPATIQSGPKIQIDPKAVELLDVTAKYYGALTSLKIVTRGSSSWQGETSPQNLTLFFERPNRVRAQGESGGMNSVVVADGKTLFMWDNWINSSVKLPQNDRYTQPLREAMVNSDYFVASYLADWLFGEHWLRPLRIGKIERDADFFEADFLPTKTVNGAAARGVRLRATKNAIGKTPKFVTQQTMWFRDDGRLVRAEQTNDFGDKIKTVSVDVVGLRTNETFPAAIWALKK